MDYLKSLLTTSNLLGPSFGSIDTLSKRLLARCLGRMLGSYQAQMESALHLTILGTLGITAIQTARSELVAALMALYETLYFDLSHAVDLRQTLRVFIAIHYSFMFASSSTVKIVMLTARTLAAEQGNSLSVSSDGPATSLHVHPISYHFQKDPVAAREMAWHASQLLVIHRRYPSNSPHEPLSVLLAGIYLWAFSRFYQPELSERRSEKDKCISFHFDAPSLSADLRTIKLGQAWIQDGGQAVIEGIGALSSPGAPPRILKIVAMMMRGLKVWGMARKISEVFVNMLRREERLPTS